jgi:outer membrane receptor protein involved in Fe transport
VNFREENFRFAPDAAYNANQSTANVVNNIAMPLGVDGTSSVKEGYVEFAIPLLSGLPFLKKLEIDPGIRFSDYSTGGNVDTWKVMADLQFTDWVRLRGGFQRANRAPNITELFSPVGASSIDFNAYDACRNGGASTPTWGNTDANPNRLNLQKLCQHLMVRDGAPPDIYVPGEATANTYNFNVFGATFPFPFDLAVQGGNPNLDSEQADTYTIGTVIRAPFEAEALRRLTLSVDYYNIDITGAIAIPSHLTVYQQCMDAQYNAAVGVSSSTGEEMAANSPYCALIRREYIPGTPTSMHGADRRFIAAYVNLGGIRTSGIDVQVDWGANLAALGLESVPGSVSVNVQYSHLDSYKVSPFPGGAFVENKGSGVNFVNRTFTTLGYMNGPFSMGLRWQHLPSLSPPPGTAATAVGVKAHDQLDLFGRWKMSERLELRFGIDNLLDADPEVVGATEDEANPSGSNNALGSSFSSNDTFGRRFFLGARVSF